jgi:septal ring factor EnvC (AmiA/AmiB activator)
VPVPRIEEKINLSETRQSTLNESGLKLSEDLKERINDLRLDGDMKTSLNERISELREANAALTASRIARDLECDEMAKRIAELGQELSSCRDKLTARSEELAAILALPKENPILIGKIHELEVAKTMLQSQLSTAKQEASKATEDLRSCQEIVLNTRKRYQELECKVIEGRTTIHRLEEEKKKLLAIHKAEVDHACQEIAKSANAAKTEVKLQYDCRVKNLEQLRSEAERELALAREELQKIQEERGSHKNNLKKVQEELSTCKKQMAQQSAHMTRANKRLPTHDELERREGRLQEAITGIAEMKTKFEAVQGQTSQKIRDAIISHQIETESLIRRIDALENEKILLEGQNSDMQKSQDIFKANVIRRLRETGILATKQSIDDWASMTANTPRQMEPPLVPISKSFTAQQPSSAASDSLISQTGSGDDETLSHGVPGTPSKASQQNELSIKSALERAKAVEAKVAKSDLTPSSYQGLHVASATFPASPAEPSPPYQGTSKALRPANRKPSSLVQSLKVAQSTTKIERNTYKVTSLDFLPSKTEDRSVAAQRPRDLAPQSGQPHVPMAQISRFVHPPHVEKPVNSYEATAGNEEQIRTTQATPRSRRHDLSHSSSPLSEVDSVDLLGYEEGLFQVGPDTMSSKSRASAHKKDIGRLRHESAHIAADSIAGIKYKEIPVSHQFPDEVDISGVDASRPLILSTTDESTRRRKPQQLKSALKKTLKTGSSCNVTLADVCMIPISENPTSSKNTPRTTISKLHPPARLGITGSSYNRIASSSKSGSTSHMAVVSSTVQRALASGKGTPGDVERSPLMGAPKRNSRKRSASEATSQPVKPFKQLRLSLPNQGRTESQTIIPDSQE